MPELQRTNVDMLKLGYGVITTNPLNPLEFMRFSSENHYEVQDRTGLVRGDIFVCRRVYDTDNSFVDVIIYPIEGNPKWRIYRAEGDTLSELVRTIQIPNRVGRQAVILEHNADQTSIFEDMQESVGEIARTLTKLSTTVAKNLRPHLAVPAGSVQVDENGNAVLDINGMVFPIPPEEKYPQYIQWDPMLESVAKNIDANLDNILVMSGLTRILISPDKVTGQVSGAALKRMFVPFVAKLDHYAQINNKAIEEIILLLNMNRAIQGLEAFAIDPRDIEVEWKYQEIFTDELETPDENGETE